MRARSMGTVHTVLSMREENAGSAIRRRGRGGLEKKCPVSTQSYVDALP